MSGFDVDVEQLRWHANTIATIADQLAGVSGRAPDRVADGALGTFSQFITAGLSGAVGRCGAAIGDVSASVDTMSVAVRRSAETYQHVDEDNADHLAGEYPR